MFREQIAPQWIKGGSPQAEPHLGKIRVARKGPSAWGGDPEEHIHGVLISNCNGSWRCRKEYEQW